MYTIKRFLYKWLPIIFCCHCRDDRSFYWQGEKFPICARCTGELAGILLAACVCAFYRPDLKSTFILMIPMIVDGLCQSFTAYESNNLKRLITGFMFGFALVMFFVTTTIMAFNYGKQIGNQLLN